MFQPHSSGCRTSDTGGVQLDPGGLIDISTILRLTLPCLVAAKRLPSFSRRFRPLSGRGLPNPPDTPEFAASIIGGTFICLPPSSQHARVS